MNLKGLDQWLINNEFYCSCKMGNNDFEYDDSEEIIYCGELADNCEDRFTKYAKSLGLKNDTDIRTLAFFHELGHYNTMSDLDAKEDFISALGKYLINKVPTYNEIIAGIKYFIYYRLPVEKIATQWAIDYINDNEEKVKEIERLIN